jgi:hypothetical protein
MCVSKASADLGPNFAGNVNHKRQLGSLFFLE